MAILYLLNVFWIMLTLHITSIFDLLCISFPSFCCKKKGHIGHCIIQFKAIRKIKNRLCSYIVMLQISTFARNKWLSSAIEYIMYE